MVIRSLAPGGRTAAAGAGLFIALGVVMAAALAFTVRWKDARDAEKTPPVKAPPIANDQRVLAAVAMSPAAPESPVTTAAAPAVPSFGSSASASPLTPTGSRSTPAAWSPSRAPEQHTTPPPPPVVSRPPVSPSGGVTVASLGFRAPEDRNKPKC